MGSCIIDDWSTIEGTDNEIKQIAENYALNRVQWNPKHHDENAYLAWKEGFEDGAHSRDKEIKCLQEEVRQLKEYLNDIKNTMYKFIR